MTEEVFAVVSKEGLEPFANPFCEWSPVRVEWYESVIWGERGEGMKIRRKRKRRERKNYF
jgi:hypothetical protein